MSNVTFKIGLDNREKHYYVDVNGKLYLANTNFTPVINRTYEEAVAAGAVCPR